MVQLGPGMYSQQQAHCPDCKGYGECFEEKDLCKKCKGKKVIDVPKLIQVTLEPGVYHEYDYIVYGEGDEGPNIMAGDLYVRILIEKHPVFKRKGADLFMQKKITLLEALSGLNFEFEHLDGQKIKVQTYPGQIIQHQTLKLVK